MPWIVKDYRTDATRELDIGEDEYRIVHTDGRETNYAECFKDEYEPEHYEEDLEPPDFDKWKSNAEGIALAMNEAEEIAEAAGFPPIYPSDIEITPGYWRALNSVEQEKHYHNQKGYGDHIEDITWRVYLLSPLGEEETVAEGEWSTDSEDSESFEIRLEGAVCIFEATEKALEKTEELNARQNPNA